MSLKEETLKKNIKELLDEFSKNCALTHKATNEEERKILQNDIDSLKSRFNTIAKDYASDIIGDWIADVSLRDSGALFHKDIPNEATAQVTYGDLRKLIFLSTNGGEGVK